MLKKPEAFGYAALEQIFGRRNIEMTPERARKMLAAVKKVRGYLLHRSYRGIILVNIPLYLGKLARECTGIAGRRLCRRQQTEKRDDVRLGQKPAVLHARIYRRLGFRKHPDIPCVGRQKPRRRLGKRYRPPLEFKKFREEIKHISVIYRRRKQPRGVHHPGRKADGTALMRRKKRVARDIFDVAADVYYQLAVVVAVHSLGEALTRVGSYAVRKDH